MDRSGIFEGDDPFAIAPRDMAGVAHLHDSAARNDDDTVFEIGVGVRIADAVRAPLEAQHATAYEGAVGRKSIGRSQRGLRQGVRGAGAVSPPRKDEMPGRDNRKVGSGYIFSLTGVRMADWPPIAGNHECAHA